VTRSRTFDPNLFMHGIYFSSHLEAQVKQPCTAQSGRLPGLIFCVRQAGGEEGMVTPESQRKLAEPVSR
jgi:hypothetical protein